MRGAAFMVLVAGAGLIPVRGVAARPNRAHRVRMATMTLSRGRLIDHVQIVVADLARSRRFYAAVLETLHIPIGGEGPGMFWADELCVSDRASPSAAGSLTGR